MNRKLYFEDGQELEVSNSLTFDTEEELGLSLEVVKHLVNTIPQRIVALWDHVHNRCVYISPGFNDFFGIDEHIADPFNKALWQGLLTPDSLDHQKEFWAWHRQILINTHILELERIFLFSDFAIISPVSGEKIWLREESKIYTFLPATGQPWLELITITELKSKLEQQLDFGGYIKNGPDIVPLRSDMRPKRLNKGLTPRQKEIVKLIVAGLTTEQIAEKLFVSTYTISTHKQLLMDRLHCKNIAELVTLVMSNKELLQ